MSGDSIPVVNYLRIPTNMMWHVVLAQGQVIHVSGKYYEEAVFDCTGRDEVNDCFGFVLRVDEFEFVEQGSYVVYLMTRYLLVLFFLV